MSRTQPSLPRTLPAIMLAALALSACMQDPPPRVDLDPVTDGAWATYEGTDGSKVTAKVVGQVQRADPWMVLVDAILIEYAYTPPPGQGWSTYSFEEAVDANGRIIQQAAACAHPWHPLNEEGPCRDSHRGTYFGAWGWPGALGAGPFWFDADVPGRFELPDRQGGDLEAIVVTTQRGGESCLHIAYQGPGPGLSLLPLTVANGNITACPGSPFPRAFETSVAWNPSFTSARRVPYHMADHGGGTGPVIRPSQGVEPRQTPIARGPVGEPPYTIDLDGLPFATWEAIQQASRLDGEVAAFRRDHPHAVPITSIYLETGASHNSFQGTSELRSERTLHLADGSGPCLRIVIKKTEREGKPLIPSLEPRTEYEVQDVSSCGNPTFDPTQVVREQVAFDAAASWAEAATGLQLGNTWLGYSHQGWVATWSAGVSPKYWYQDGYVLSIQFKDPDPVTIGSVEISSPPEMILDGPSGAVQFMALPPG